MRNGGRGIGNGERGTGNGEQGLFCGKKIVWQRQTQQQTKAQVTFKQAIAAKLKSEPRNLIVVVRHLSHICGHLKTFVSVILVILALFIFISF